MAIGALRRGKAGKAAWMFWEEGIKPLRGGGGHSGRSVCVGDSFAPRILNLHHIHASERAHHGRREGGKSVRWFVEGVKQRDGTWPLCAGSSFEASFSQALPVGAFTRVGYDGWQGLKGKSSSLSRERKSSRVGIPLLGRRYLSAHMDTIGVKKQFRLLYREGEVDVLQREAAAHADRNATCVVRTREEARRAVDLLLSLPKNTVFACDTETTGIDPKVESPVGKGRVVCLSVYCGPEVNFSECGQMLLMSGEEGEVVCCLWADTMGPEGDGVMQEFKRFLEEESCLKCWHNYSYDKHVLGNHGVHCKGFAGDTVHMARLWNSSRSQLSGTGGYSLASLSEDLLAGGKTDMKKLFGRATLRKDGSQGKTIRLQDAADIQVDLEQFESWVLYSTKDAKVTWWLYKLLEVCTCGSLRVCISFVLKPQSAVYLQIDPEMFDRWALISLKMQHLLNPAFQEDTPQHNTSASQFQPKNSGRVEEKT